jgi:hypothetical protein
MACAERAFAERFARSKKLRGSQMAEAKANVSDPTAPTAEKEVEAKSNPSSRTSQPNLFALTISADTGEVVKIEKVEGTGARRDLQDDDQVMLALKDAPALDALIERAFEAGIACVLGAQDEREDAEETDEEADLRRALLMPLIDNTLAKGLLEQGVLGKAILASAIAQVARTASRDKGDMHQKAEGRVRRPN